MPSWCRVPTLYRHHDSPQRTVFLELLGRNPRNSLRQQNRAWTKSIMKFFGLLLVLLSLCCLSSSIIRAEAAFNSAHTWTKGHTATVSRKANPWQAARASSNCPRFQRWNEHVQSDHVVRRMSSSTGGSYDDVSKSKSTNDEQEAAALPLPVFLLGTFFLGSLSIIILHVGWQLGLQAVSYAHTMMHAWGMALLTNPLFQPILYFRDEVIQPLPSVELPLLPLEVFAFVTGVGLTLYILIETLPVSFALLAFLAMYVSIYAPSVNDNKGTIKEGFLQQQIKQQRLRQLGDYDNVWEKEGGDCIVAVGNDQIDLSSISVSSSSSVQAGIQQWLKITNGNV